MAALPSASSDAEEDIPPVGIDQDDPFSSMEEDALREPVLRDTGQGEVLTVAGTDERLEVRARHASDPLDAVVCAGRRMAPGSGSEIERVEQRYLFFGLRTPWFSAGRLTEPFLYRLAANSLTTAANLDRRSLEQPFPVVSALPSFSTTEAVINRVVAHPFGDPAVLWVGGNAGEQEAGLHLRIQPAEELAFEALGLFHHPSVSGTFSSGDVWFPDSELDPIGDGASLAASLWYRGRRTTVVSAIIASGGLLWPPGAAWIAQTQFQNTSTRIRVRTAWATADFRSIRNGLPAVSEVTDALLDLGIDRNVGGRVSAAHTLFRPEPVPNAYVPDRITGTASVHLGPDYARIGSEFTSRTDRSAEGECQTERRFKVSGLLGNSGWPVALEASWRLYRVEDRHDRTVVRVALRTSAGCLSVVIAPALELKPEKPGRLEGAAIIGLVLDRIECRLSIQTRHPIDVGGTDGEIPMVATFSLRSR